MRHNLEPEHTVEIGEVGRYGHFVSHCPVESRIDEFHVFHDFTIKVLANVSPYLYPGKTSVSLRTI
jgi:hypothetical protein